jgi:fumarylacetoacetate (FAA) hydrolase family protein
VPLSNRSIEVLAQSEGPFVRLVDLAATLFECRAAVLTLRSTEAAVVRVNGQAEAQRISLEIWDPMRS